MRLAHRLAAIALTGAVLPAVSTAATAATTPRCHGRVATVVGTMGDDVLRGTPHADVMVGLGGRDRIDGGGGNDVICAGPGDDEVRGDGGNDLIIDARDRDQRGHNALLVGGRGNDRLYAATAYSAILGGRGNDRLVNLSGVPTFYAEAGDDTIIDRSPATSRFDLRHSPVGLRFDASAGRLTGWGSDRVHLRDRHGITVVGTRYDDVLVGTGKGDVLYGRLGDDVVRGLGGNDNLSGGGGDNRVYGGVGKDGISLVGSTVARGGPDRDVMFEGGPEDTVSGGTGDDLAEVDVAPGSGPRIDLGPGANELGITVLPPGPDTAWAHISVDLAAGVLDADGIDSHFIGTLASFGAGDAVTARPAGSWEVDGTDGPERIDVRTAHVISPVVLRGLGGDDRLVTGNGNDTLDGGAGIDRGDAHGGTDSCVSIESGLGGRPTGCETSTP